MRKTELSAKELETAKYYDTHSILDDWREAEKNGDLIVTTTGESPAEAILKHIAKKKAEAA